MKTGLPYLGMIICASLDMTYLAYLLWLRYVSEEGCPFDKLDSLVGADGTIQDRCCKAITWGP
jgi:hypothetical protein